jgi:hypothetical protein
LPETRELARLVKRMSNPEAVLESIWQRRETRDRLLLQHSIPILEQLRNVVHSWIDGEFKDLEDELSNVDEFTVRDRASERIGKFRTQLTKIRNEELPSAMRELEELIGIIKKQEFESAHQATEILSKKINPIVSVIFNLSSARDKLDGMADMIPLPTIERIRSDE